MRAIGDHSLQGSASALSASSQDGRDASNDDALRWHLLSAIGVVNPYYFEGGCLIDIIDIRCQFTAPFETVARPWLGQLIPRNS